MADKDQFNDEYQFADLDAINPDVADNSSIAEEKVGIEKERKFSPTDNIKRNALIVVVVVILAMLIYKFVGSYFSEKKIAAQSTSEIPTPTTAVVKEPVVETPPPQELPTSQLPSQPSVQTSQVDPMVDQKLSALEISQQSMRSEVAKVNNQLGGISNNVTTLGSQISQLNQTIAALAAKVESQSQAIEILTHPKPVKVQRVVKSIVTVTRYFIQAVIPGRAWLISPNGATLTVREGTTIPGYGIVKLIDPNQGRITTSSGQVIRFSQEDS